MEPSLALATSETQLDVSQWPVVIVTTPAGSVSDAHIDEFIQRFEAEVRGQQRPYATVMRLTQGGGITAKQRAYMASRMRDGSSQEDCKGTAFVLTSAVMRGLLTAVLWIRKPAYPVATFRSLPEGIEWARDQVNRTASAQ
jgi:hypothetical protein